MQIYKSVHTQRGQVVIIGVLLMSIFAIIGASIATQMVYEQRRVKLEEKSQKAYYAAESGMEDALRLLKLGTYTNQTLSLDGITVNTTSTSVGNSTIYDLSSQGIFLNSGESSSIDLKNYTGNSLVLCWNKASTSVIMQVQYVKTDGSYAVKPFVFNSSAAQDPKIESGDTATVGTRCGKTGWYDATVDLGTLSALSDLDFATVWVWYSDTVSFIVEGDQNLPAQGQTVRAVATVADLENTVTRQIKTFISARTYPPTSLLFGFINGGGVSFGPGRNW